MSCIYCRINPNNLRSTCCIYFVWNYSYWMKCHSLMIISQWLYSLKIDRFQIVLCESLVIPSLLILLNNIRILHLYKKFNMVFPYRKMLSHFIIWHIRLAMHSDRSLPLIILQKLLKMFSHICFLRTLNRLLKKTF